MKYAMKDMRTGRALSATAQQRDFLLKTGRAELVADDAPEVEDDDATEKKAKRSYKRRDLRAED